MSESALPRSRPILPIADAFVRVWKAAVGFILLHSPHDVIDAIAVAGAGLRKSVFVISRHNLLRASDRGGWQRLTAGLGGWKLSSLVLSPRFEVDGTLFVASFGGGVLRSRDGGLNWESGEGLGEPHIILVGLSRDYEHSRAVFALGLSGTIYRSGDAGDTWNAVWPGHAADHEGGGASDDVSGVLLDPLRDAGELWRKCHWIEGPSCIGFALDAVVVGTSDGELIASRDHGATWERLAVTPRRSRITCIEIPAQRGLEGPFFIGTDTESVLRVTHGGDQVSPMNTPPSLRCVTALGTFVDEAGHLVLVACSWGDALFVSTDEGAHWALAKVGLTKHRQAAEPRYDTPHFRAIAAPQHGSSGDVYVGGFDGLFRTHELGQPWQSVETLPLANVLGVAVGPSEPGKDPAIAVATYGAGVYLKSSGADAWEVLNRGLDTLRLGDVAFSPDWGRDRTLFTVCEASVLRSVDKGPWLAAPLRPRDASGRSSVQWFAKLRGVERRLAKYLSGRWMARIKAVVQVSALRTTGQMNHYVFPTLVVFSRDYAGDHTLFVGTRSHGIFCSRDGGASFVQLWAADGLFVSSLGTTNGPAGSGKLFASVSDGLHRSDDGGASWARISSDRPFRSARVAVSPNFARDRTIFVGGREGLLRSRDGGTLWQSLEIDSASELSVGGLAISPNFETDLTLLVHLQGRGLYRSRDGGDTFEGLPWTGSISDHAFTPLVCFPDSNTLFQFSPHFAEDRTIAAAAFANVFVSGDGGSTWSAQNCPTRFESSRREIVYVGRWTVGEHDEFSAKRAHHSRSANDTASLRFVGDSVTWIGTRGPDHGLADVFVDDKKVAVVDLFAPTREFSVNLFSMRLPAGEHEIMVGVTGARRERSTGSEVWIDAFDVQRSD